MRTAPCFWWKDETEGFSLSIGVSAKPLRMLSLFILLNSCHHCGRGQLKDEYFLSLTSHSHIPFQFSSIFLLSLSSLRSVVVSSTLRWENERESLPEHATHYIFQKFSLVKLPQPFGFWRALLFIQIIFCRRSCCSQIFFHYKKLNRRN